MNVANLIKENIYLALKELKLNNFLDQNSILLEIPADKSHGDYSTNVAMKLFGQLKKQDVFDHKNYRSPRDLARAIVDFVEQQISATKIDDKIRLFSKIEVAGSGFINFTLSDPFLLSKMGFLVKKGVRQPIGNIKTRKKVMIEFTDPNPFKELHIGHLYSNIVGETISKLYESQGWEVKRACYQGDVGMHVSKSIWGMKILLNNQYQDKKIKDAVKELAKQPLDKRIAFLGKSYALGATAYQDNEDAKKQIKNINYLVYISAQANLTNTINFQSRVDYRKFISNFSIDSSQYQEISMLYVLGREWSLEYFDSIYARAGMSFDEFFFESLVGEFGYQIVNENLSKGIFEKSKGAIIFPGSKYGLHDRVFINSLGLPTYEAKELGLVPEKYRRYKYDKSIIITANEINEYFKVLLKALEFTSPKLRTKTIHLSHGMVKLPEGKMSSRTGKVITAKWLMDEANHKIKTYMVKNRPEFNSDEIDHISEVVGLGAIKFTFLKQSVGKDIAFNFKDSLSFTGNSGPYVQYTYVRCHSVLARAQNEVFNDFHTKKTFNDFDKNIANEERYIAKQFDTLLNDKSYIDYKLNSDEKDILRNLNRYYFILKSATEEHAPHYLANYLYELSQSFNKFYTNNQIINSNQATKVETKVRLLLVRAVGMVVKHGLNILGISVVKRM